MTDILALALWFFLLFPGLAGRWFAKAVTGYKNEMNRK